MCHQVNFKCCFETIFSLRRIHYEESTLYIPFRRGDMRHPSEVMEQVYYMQPSNKRPFPAVLDLRNVFVMKVQNGLDVIYTSGNEHLHIEALLLSLLLFWVCLRHPTDVGMGFLAIVSIIQRPRYKTRFDIFLKSSGWNPTRQFPFPQRGNHLLSTAQKGNKHGKLARQSKNFDFVAVVFWC